jgi:dipeptidyl aminopeptidase/acylaminoacyl peptidase
MHADLRQTPRYQEIEDFVRRTQEPAFGRISGALDPDPSPDGRRVAFTGTKLEGLEGVPSGRVCVADVETSTFEVLTAGPNDDRFPRWSPDGSTLAFLSDRAERGRFQLYLLSAGRLGEAVAAPAVEGTVEYLAWSPDGRSILLGSAGAGAELAAVQGSGHLPEDEGEAPSWMPTVRSTSDEEGWRRAWAYDVASGEVRAASREGLNVWESAWLGSGQLVAVVSEGPGEGTWYLAALVAIDVESGKERPLLTSEVQFGFPSASPSGDRVAVIEALCSDRLVVAGDLLVLDANGGEPRRIDAHGVDVSHAGWADEERLLYIGVRGLDTVAGWVDPATGIAEETFVTGESGVLPHPDLRPLRDGAFVTVLSGYERHPEVVLVRDGEVRTVAEFSHDGSKLLRSMIGTLERVAWTAPDGLEIQGLLARPEGSGPFPMVTSVHGGPVGATVERWGMRSLPLSILVSRGYAVLYPNPRGGTGRGQDFARMVYGDMGGADAADILAGVDAMVERGIADRERLGVTGGSYGGFMSAWLVGQTDRFAAAVAISPVTDWYSQHLTSNIGHWDREILEDELSKPGGEYFARSPIAFAHRANTPTLVTAGLQDRCTPPGQAEEFFTALLEAGVESELALYPEEGHGVRKFPAAIDFTTRLVGWFERHMPAGEPKASA